MGYRKFCRQSYFTEEENEEIANKEATLSCNCEEALNYQSLVNKKEFALTAIDTLVGDKAEAGERIDYRVINLLKDFLDAMCDNDINKLSVVYNNGTKIHLKKTAKNEFSVEREKLRKEKITS